MSPIFRRPLSSIILIIGSVLDFALVGYFVYLMVMYAARPWIGFLLALCFVAPVLWILKNHFIGRRTRFHREPGILGKVSRGVDAAPTSAGSVRGLSHGPLLRRAQRLERKRAGR